MIICSGAIKQGRRGAAPASKGSVLNTCGAGIHDPLLACGTAREKEVI